ncbi:MAG TPA: histidine-type phosphatase [Acidobacteriaceae bacterium]
MYFSRHGVRSPTGAAAQYNRYSAGVWPEWDVPPGYLTPHGYHLMELFGSYDRDKLAQQGLLSTEGCADTGKVTIDADSDQRTRESGSALAKGLFPGCQLPVTALPEGTPNPLFHASVASTIPLSGAQAVAAIAGRIGNNPNNLTEAYRPQLASLDHLLATCGRAPAGESQRTSLLDIPATLSVGHNDHAVELQGPLNTAATLTENILLEYTEGMDPAKVGWGCVDGATVRSLIALHAAASDFARRTPEVASLQAAGLLEHIREAIEQAVTHHAIVGAPSRVTDLALFMIGHDTNIENMAGMLNLNWIVDGRRDDTPPGCVVVFELWKVRATGAYEVRLYFTTQTVEQMRFAKQLSLEVPPDRVPIFVPGCSRADFSCSWESFSRLTRQPAGVATAAPRHITPEMPMPNHRSERPGSDRYPN